MKLTTKPGGKTVSLTKRNFLASGGQGEVYVIGGRAYKVYHDPKNMIPTGKIASLQGIRNPNVIKPEAVLCNSKGKPVGYDMRFIKDAWTACQLFPKAFRNRNGFSPDKAAHLVTDLRAMVADVHQAGVLIVDLNEMNLLVARDFSEVYGIDADSYQTSQYPATVIMPSVMDPKVRGNDFTEMSDWFSFGIVAFQMLVGIHPFKGKHTGFTGPDKLKARMEAGVSVFNKDVRVPKAVLPFDVIPDAYRDWFKQVFEKGARIAPPTGLTGTIVFVPVIRTIGGTRNLDITLHRQYVDEVIGHWHSYGTEVTLTQTGVYVGAQRVNEPFQGVVGVAYTPRNNTPVLASLRGPLLQLFDLSNRRGLKFPLAVDQAMHCDGRIYVKVEGAIHEVVLAEAGGKVIPSSQRAANCMENATKLYDGVAVQNMLGKTFVSLFPDSGISHTLALPELDEYTVVDARCIKNVLMVVGVKPSGQYDRLVFRFNTARSEYDLRTVEDITPTGLNFTVLDTGVAACLTEDEKLELFAAKRGHPGVKVVEDAVLGSDMTLGSQDGRVVFWRGDKVYRVKTK
jgi:hypothetical protein